MARRGDARSPLAMHLLEPVESIVHRIGQVRRRAPRLAAPDRSVVEHDDRLSDLRQQVRRRDAGDPRADDADIRRRIFRER